MTAYELRRCVESRGTKTHFFSRENMRFAGDTMRNYGVRRAKIRTYSGEVVECWDLYRRRPVKYGLRTSAYFSAETFAQVFSLREPGNNHYFAAYAGGDSVMAIASQTTIQAYQLRAGGVRARMAILRRIAADSVRNANPHTRLHPGDWRGARHTTLKGYAAYYGLLDAGREAGGTPIWSSHAGEYFRRECDAPDLLGRRTGGWYTDAECHDTAIGIVACLPHGRFIAGYRWTSNDERVYFPGVFDDETDTARMADEYARVFAESAREDNERWQAMCLAELAEETAREELEKSIALRHRAKFGGFERVREHIEKLRDARETLAEATRRYEKGC